MKKIFALVFAILLMLACASSYAEGHLYDDAEIVPLYNGTKTSVVGQVSLVTVPKKNVTTDTLSDWYFNYVVSHKDDYNFCLIKYEDSAESLGIYAGSGMVIGDVVIGEDNLGPTWAQTNDSFFYSFYRDKVATQKEINKLKKNDPAAINVTLDAKAVVKKNTVTVEIKTNLPDGSVFYVLVSDEDMINTYETRVSIENGKAVAGPFENVSKGKYELFVSFDAMGNQPENVRQIIGNNFEYVYGKMIGEFGTIKDVEKTFKVK